MKDLIGQFASDAASNPKIVAAAVAGTTLTGTTTFLEILPGLVGGLASLTGLILSIVFIVVTIKRDKRERVESHRADEKHQIEMELLLKKLNGQNKTHDTDDR